MTSTSPRIRGVGSRQYQPVPVPVPVPDERVLATLDCGRDARTTTEPTVNVVRSEEVRPTCRRVPSSIGHRDRMSPRTSRESSANCHLERVSPRTSRKVPRESAGRLCPLHPFCFGGFFDSLCSLPKNKLVYILGAIRRGAQRIRKDARVATPPRSHFTGSSQPAGSVPRWGTASSTAKMAVATHYPTAAV